MEPRNRVPYDETGESQTGNDTAQWKQGGGKRDPQTLPKKTEKKE